MDKKRTNRSLFIAFAVIILIGSFSIISGALLLEPGSEEDPIVTLGYVEKRLEQIKYYINQNVETLNGNTQQTNTTLANINSELGHLKSKVDELSQRLNNMNTSGGGTPAKFEVIFIEAGKSIYLGESAEVIWRSGKAAAIASNVGLSDLTAGRDIQSGEEIPLNHLILIPRNDGRGMAVSIDSYVMVKGGYSIK